MVQGFTGSTEVDLPLPCTYDFEVTGSQYLHAVQRRRSSRCCCCSPAPSSPGAHTGFGVEQVPWDCEASLPAAGRGLAADDRAELPEHRLAAAGPRRARTRWPTTRPARPDHAGTETRRSALLAARRGTGRAVRDASSLDRRARRRRRGALRGLPALPLPGHLGEEPGALAVRRARAAGRGRRRLRRGRRNADAVPARRAGRRRRTPRSPCTCGSCSSRSGRERPTAAVRRPAELRVDGTRCRAGTRRSSRSSRCRRRAGPTFDGRVRRSTVTGGEDVEPVRDGASTPVGAGLVRPLAAAAAGRADRGSAPYVRLVRLDGAVDNELPSGHGQGRRDPALADRRPPADRGRRRGVRLAARPAGRRPQAAAARCRQHRCWPGARRADPGTTDVVLGSPIILYDHPEIAAESAGRAVRLHRDRRDPHPAGDDHDRRGEGRGPGHRPAGRGDHRPLRRRCPADDLQQLHGVLRDPHGRRPPSTERAPGRHRRRALVGPGRGRDGSSRRWTRGHRRGQRRKGSLVRVHPSPPGRRPGPVLRRPGRPGHRGARRRRRRHCTSPWCWSTTRPPTCTTGTAATSTSRPDELEPLDPAREESRS